MNYNYSHLKDVKIIKKKEASELSLIAYDYFASTREPVRKEPEQWVAVYHIEHKKYIVTEDLINAGLKGSPKNIEIVGHSDSLDGIMFIIWEHQVANGVKDTILDQIKRHKVRLVPRVDEYEWNWADESKKEPKLVAKDIKTMRITDTTTGETLWSSNLTYTDIHPYKDEDGNE